MHYSFIFDFDGTVIDTNFLKYDALVASLRSLRFLELKDFDIEAYAASFIARSGISRMTKFTNDFSLLLPKSSILQLCSTYTTNVSISTQSLQLDTRTIDALNKFTVLGSCHILSGSVLPEVLRILNNSSVTSCFSSLICDCSNKRHFLDAFSNDSPGSVLFFGDSQHDFSSTIGLDVEFIRVTGYSDLSVDRGEYSTIDHISDFFLIDNSFSSALV